MLARSRICRTTLPGLLLLSATCGPGCERKPDDAAKNTAAGAGQASAHQNQGERGTGDDHEHHHHHTAPRGGALISLGDHVAHLEILLDPQTGVLDVYVLDGEAEGAIRVAHSGLTLSLTEVNYSGGRTVAEPLEVDLAAVASPLSGETVGDSSHLQGQHAALIDASSIRARLAEITIRGQTHRDVPITWPEGDH